MALEALHFCTSTCTAKVAFVVVSLQTVKEKVVGSPETTSEKAQRVAKETVGSASQTVKDATSKAHSQASDIAQDAQDAYNRQHGDSAYQKACSALMGALHAGISGWPCCLKKALSLTHLRFTLKITAQAY